MMEEMEKVGSREVGKGARRTALGGKRFVGEAFGAKIKGELGLQGPFWRA